MILMLMMALQQVIVTTENVDVGTVDNQENVEPDNRKDPARFAIFRQILPNLHGHIDDGLDYHLDDNLDLEQDDRP